MSNRTLAVALLPLALILLINSSRAYMNPVMRLTETNSPPVAANDSYTVHGGTNIGPFLINDSDPDGDSIVEVEIVTFPTHGNLTGLPQIDRKMYGPHSGYVGPDSFTYRCKDSFNNWSNTATVSLNVVNTAPVAQNDSYNVHGATNIGPFMFNDSDPDGDSISFYDILTYPSHGTLTGLAQPDRKRYNPHSGYTGPDSFTYKICDSLGLCSAPATVNVTVINEGPVAAADFYVARGGTIIGPFMSNDFDPDGDSFSFYDIMTFPAHGNLYGLPYPSYGYDNKTYAPHAGYTGSDSFTYKICDQFNLCSTATVYILVLPGPDPVPKVAGCPTDPKDCDDFIPSQGGFRGVSSPSSTAGPSGPDPVNLTTGRESFVPPADLTVYNPAGPGVFWQLGYLSYQAFVGITGYGSPGLARGWVHGYDVTLKGTAGSWGTLTLNYPSGASESLTPQLDGSGQPTGAFTSVAGAPYIVTGVAGTPAGTWQSVTITWKDQTKWKFTLLSGTTYVLNQLTNRTGQSLNFTWNSSRALTQITDGTSP